MADNFKVTKVKLKKSGVIKLLKSQEIMDELQKVGSQHFEEIDSTFVGFDRCHVVCKENKND